MSYKDELERLIQVNNGFILTKDVSKAGIPREYISRLVEEGILIKVDRSSYITKDGYDDKLYRLQVKHPHMIYSHESSLTLNRLIEDELTMLTVTVASGYHSENLNDSGIKVHTIKKEYLELGTTIMKTPYNRNIRVYNMERTICDIVRNRNHMDSSIFSQALKNYINRTDKNIEQLQEYADYFNIIKQMNLYFAVLF